MFDPLSIYRPPYDCNQFINNLQAYNTWENNDEMLNLFRHIQQSGNYYWQGVCFPDSSYLPNSTNANAGFGPGKTVNGVIVVPPGSYVTSMTSYSSQPDGFRFKLYDKGTKVSIFYGDYSKQNPVTSNMLTTGIYAATPSDPGSNSDIPFGPNLLMSPLIVTGPGVLGWEIVNGNTQADTINVIQVMLGMAIPITNRSILQVVVDKDKA